MSRIQDQAADLGANVAGKARDKVNEVSENLRDIGHQVRETAEQKFGEAKDRASNYYNRSREAAQEWEQSLESYVQGKPLQAVLIAAGVGLILGLIWRRR